MDASITRHFIVATAGHVDHGKSALVKALTGTNPDRLPEEKARGITIDLGFAHLQLAAASVASAAILDVGIIDVPGHEDFVKNMVAGAGSIDLALLVVAADDGWMPQTEEHLQILAYLGVERAVVALTKIDLAQSTESVCTALLREKLRGSPFAQAPVVPTSIVTGRGLDELKAALAQQLALVPSPRALGKPRLPIDRAFTLQGVGTVVTGTLHGGCLQAGQEVLIQPAGIATRIRTIQSYNQQVEYAVPGTRTALNLANVSLHAGGRDGAGDAAVRRGCVVTLPDLGRAHDTCDLLLERSPRLLATHAAASRPLRGGLRVRFHAGSSNVPGRLYLSGRHELGPGERCLAQIRLESPVYAFLGDCFVLRDWPEQLTLGGGIVLDPCASRKSHAFSGGTSSAGPHLCNSTSAVMPASESQCVLGTASPAPITPQLALAAQLQARRVLNKGALLVQSNFSSTEIADALSQLRASGQCAVVGDWVVETQDWTALRERAQILIKACHQAHPEQAGFPLAELRSALSSHLPVPELFESLVAELLRSGFSQMGAAIQRTGHRPQLPAPLQLDGTRIRAALALRPLEPPSRKELAPHRASQEALAFLLRTNEAVELGPDLVLSASAFARASEVIRQFLGQHGSATVSELRQALGASRRVVVPLLEKLDRQGVTRREGDKRTLKR